MMKLSRGTKFADTRNGDSLVGVPGNGHRGSVPENQRGVQTLTSQTIVCPVCSRDRIDEILHGAEYVSDPFDLNPVTLSAGALSSEATAAGLRDGDIVSAVEGRPVEGLSDYYGALRRARRGDQLRLHVRSNVDRKPEQAGV